MFSIKKPAFRQGRAWIELSRAALRHNVEVLRALLPPGCELMPAVKAEAYGHGAVLVARELNALGVNAFCVATVAEGVQLRKNGIRDDILVLGYTHPEQFPLLGRYRLIQTVLDYDYARALNQYGRPVRVHIGVDTGMHRLGERWENTDRLCGICRMKNLRVLGLYSHLCADDTTAPAEKSFTLAQGRALYTVAEQLRLRGFACPKVHLQASYGVLNYPELAGDYARIGIALYGMLGTRADTQHCPVPLTPVLSVKAKVALVRDLYRGETAGYGLAFAAPQDMRIAVVALGYGDGLPRSLSDGVGRMLIRGCAAPIVGHICMDQTLVDVTAIPDAAAGDTAVVIGTSGSLTVTACDLAEQAGTIANEILSRLGGRLERQWA